MSDNTVSTNAIVIERIFDAPVDVVWKLWTEPKHFQKWYGPNGMKVPVAEMDVRVGGKHLICMEMQTPDRSMTMWTTGEYTEVIPNQRLVYTDSPADENGNVVSQPDGHPMTTEVIVELEDLDGRTRMVMTHVGMPAGSPGEQGWNQAFIKMADYIGTIINAG